MIKSISGIAGPSDGSREIGFLCTYGVNFIANDSNDYALKVNFDAPTNLGGFELKPGETISDLRIMTKSIYLEGVAGQVPYRAVGI